VGHLGIVVEGVGIAVEEFGTAEGFGIAVEGLDTAEGLGTAEELGSLAHLAIEANIADIVVKEKAPAKQESRLIARNSLVSTSEEILIKEVSRFC
jgi:hypothetical protein